MSNEIYFTRNTRRAGRIGDTMVVVTEGARITITLQPNGQPAKVTVAKAKPATPATAPATPGHQAGHRAPHADHQAGHRAPHAGHAGQGHAGQGHAGQGHAGHAGQGHAGHQAPEQRRAPQGSSHPHARAGTRHALTLPPLGGFTR